MVPTRSASCRWVRPSARRRSRSLVATWRAASGFVSCPGMSAPGAPVLVESLAERRACPAAFRSGRASVRPGGGSRTAPPAPRPWPPRPILWHFVPRRTCRRARAGMGRDRDARGRRRSGPAIGGRALLGPWRARRGLSMLRTPPRRRRAGPPPERPRERGGIAVAEQVGDPPEREVALRQVPLRQPPPPPPHPPPQPLDQARRRQPVLGQPPPQGPGAHAEAAGQLRCAELARME